MSLGNQLGASSSERTFILNCLRLPAKLTKEQAAILLGFQPHDIPVLVTGRFLTPIGKPSQQAPKWFARVEVEALGENVKKLGEATARVSKFWQGRNARKTKSGGEDQAA